MRLFLLLYILLLSACSSMDSDQNTLNEAFSQTKMALEKHDASRLWELSDQKSKEKILSLIGDAKEEMKHLSSLWDEDEQERAEKALGKTLLDALPDEEKEWGEAFTKHLFPFSDLDTSHFPEAPKASYVTHIDGKEPKAIVTLPSGEQLTFVLEDGHYKHGLLKEIILDSPKTRSLLAHISKSKSLWAEHLHQLKVSDDPTSPEGAYNLARRAQNRAPQDINMLYALLDEESRLTLTKILQDARSQQKRIQQTTALNKRASAYEKAGISDLVMVDSGELLFKSWLRAKPDFKLLLGSDAPVDLHYLNPKEALITTQSQVEVSMVLDEDGFWRLGKLSQRLIEELGPKALEESVEAP